DLDLLTRLYSTQLVTKGEKHLLDNKRLYYKLLRKIVTDGQKKGELTQEMSVNEIVKIYAMCERALLYDWCLCNGDYSLKNYAKTVMPMFLYSIKI
ncbi:MAG: TetR/AcrR family transcriptional regulator C-terminal domain-containing protein, partial [Bacteroidia bacterium]|nr:TetR/AcrR family transcriptional regulator C-terminal domain-containing protein [Bacteroidia bacterium]